MLNPEMIQRAIESYIQTYALDNNRSRWRKPLVAFADAADPDFLSLKEHIGPNYYLPEELLPGAKSVIVFFVPHDEITMKKNNGEQERSLAWDIAYFDTNNLIRHICEMLVELLKKEGYMGIAAPATIESSEVIKGEEFPVISNWSHRHTAQIAGLGTFGLNNMLITRSGCCGRLGSLITDAELPASSKLIDEYCLYKRNGSCIACSRKCTNGCFVEKNGVLICDKNLCNSFLHSGRITPLKESPGNSITCGKCLCGLPCSLAAPP